MPTKATTKEPTVTNIGILDQIAAEAGPKRTSTVVNTKLGVKAHAAIRAVSVQSGVTMSQIVSTIVHDALARDGVDVDDHDEPTGG